MKARTPRMPRGGYPCVGILWPRGAKRQAGTQYPPPPALATAAGRRGMLGAAEMPPFLALKCQYSGAKRYYSAGVPPAHSRRARECPSLPMTFIRCAHAPSFFPDFKLNSGRCKAHHIGFWRLQPVPKGVLVVHQTKALCLRGTISILGMYQYAFTTKLLQVVLKCLKNKGPRVPLHKGAIWLAVCCWRLNIFSQ